MTAKKYINVESDFTLLLNLPEDYTGDFRVCVTSSGGGSSTVCASRENGELKGCEEKDGHIYMVIRHGEFRPGYLQTKTYLWINNEWVEGLQQMVAGVEDIIITQSKNNTCDLEASIDILAPYIKGDKGDPLTYDDLTEEQKNDLLGSTRADIGAIWRNMVQKDSSTTDEMLRVYGINPSGSQEVMFVKTDCGDHYRTIMGRDNYGHTEVADPTWESHAANKRYVDNIASSKLDKVTTTSVNRNVYGKEPDGSQVMISVAKDIKANSIACRRDGGDLWVNDAPMNDKSAVNKKYVDSGLRTEAESRTASDAALGERIDNIQLTPGPTGPKGADGVSIVSVQQIESSEADEGENIIEVTLSNGVTDRFVVRNGSKGHKGDKGATGATGAVGPRGPQGEPLRYTDLTDAQKAELQKPATDAAAQVMQTEQSVKAAEASRVVAEQARQTASATAVANANAAADNANDKAQVAQSAAVRADEAVEAIDEKIAGKADVSQLVDQKAMLFAMRIKTVDDVKTYKMDPRFKYVPHITGFSWSTIELFKKSPALEIVDSRDWDMSIVTNMGEMFRECPNLREVDVSQWDMRNVTSINNLFTFSSAITHLDMSKWQTPKLTTIGGFLSRTSIEHVDLGNLDVSNVKEAYSIFFATPSVKSISFRGWNTKKMNDIRYLFSVCDSLESVDLSTCDFVGIVDPVYATDWCYGNKNLRHLGPIGLKNVGFDCNFGVSPLESDAVDVLVHAIIDLTGTDTQRTLTFSPYTKSIMTDEQVAAILEKGWTIA